MIAYIKGQVKQKTEKYLILENQGMGYRVFVAEHLNMQTKIGEELEVYTHAHWSTREETVDIYGFQTLEELEFFEQLIDISGVGRKSALAALSVAKIAELKKTIARGEPALLQKVAGIGKKTAERIVVELKDKIVSGDSTVPISGSDGEVISALEGLGYKAYDIREIIRQLPENLETSEAKIKAALKMLGKR